MKQKFLNLEIQFMFLFSGYHENVVGYYSSWFENEHLYIQLELCDRCLSINTLPKLLTEIEALDAMYQVSSLNFFLSVSNLFICLFHKPSVSAAARSSL